MKPNKQTIIYTLLAADLPVAAIEATGVEARELLKDSEFLVELAAPKVDGPIYSKRSSAALLNGA
jgi:hypothetical protein